MRYPLFLFSNFNILKSFIKVHDFKHKLGV